MTALPRRGLLAALAVSPPAATPPGPVASPGRPRKLALTLAYLGGQYFSYVARGAPLPSVLTGNGAGAVTGARQMRFNDSSIAWLAADLADDKAAHVTALRGQIGASAPAQPAIDLSPGASGAFSLAAQRAGIVGLGQAFDPYADDTHFLIGALLIENAVAASYRRLLLVEPDSAGGCGGGSAAGPARRPRAVRCSAASARCAPRSTARKAATRSCPAAIRTAPPCSTRKDAPSPLPAPIGRC